VLRDPIGVVNALYGLYTLAQGRAPTLGYLTPMGSECPERAIYPSTGACPCESIRCPCESIRCPCESIRCPCASGTDGKRPRWGLSHILHAQPCYARFVLSVLARHFLEPSLQHLAAVGLIVTRHNLGQFAIGIRLNKVGIFVDKAVGRLFLVLYRRISYCVVLISETLISEMAVSQLQR